MKSPTQSPANLADKLVIDQLAHELILDPNNADAMESLVYKLKPTIMTAAQKYRYCLPYTTEEYMQEGRIVIWETTSRGNFREGDHYLKYFYRAIRFHFSKLYRDYIWHNDVCLGYVRIERTVWAVMGESPIAEELRRKHREECRRSSARRRAKLAAAAAAAAETV